MTIDHKTRAGPYSRRRNFPRRQSAPKLRVNPSTSGPALSFSELIGRLSKGRLDPQVARELLRIDAAQISLNIQIDRETGLVRDWNLRTAGASAPDAKIVAGKTAPAA